MMTMMYVGQLSPQDSIRALPASVAGDLRSQFIWNESDVSV